MNRRTWIILGILVLVIILCACLAVGMLVGWGLVSQNRTSVSDAYSTEFEIAPAATLWILNPVGDVVIETGREGVVSVHARREVRAFLSGWAQELLDRIDIETESDAQRASITVFLPKDRRLRSSKVDLTIVVPPSLDLDVVNQVGQVRISGTEGDLRLRSSVGDIVLHDVVVAENYDVINDVGAIRFYGRLPHGSGEVLLKSRIGDVEVAVPDGSPFALNAETRLGKVDSGFRLDSLQAGKTSGGAGMWLHGHAHTQEGGARLVLRTETGDIEIRATR